MAVIAPVTAASPGGGEVIIPVPAVAAVAVGSEVPPLPQVRTDEDGGAASKANPEKQLSRFVRCVAFGEWAGNAFGALAFVWATGVLLGGFCTSLNPQDFWFAAVVIFIEAFRIFSRSYKLDSQFLFGTTRALRWINSSFLRMLLRPQEGDQVVLIMGLWMNFIDQLRFLTIAPNALIFEMALLIPWSRRSPRRPQKWRMRAIAISYLLLAAYKVATYVSILIPQPLGFVLNVLPVVIVAGTVLLLNLRPRRLTNLTITPWGRRLISLAKVTSALWLAAADVLVMYPLVGSAPHPLFLFYHSYFDTSFPILVLSLSSLQNDHDADTKTATRWTDAVIHICFIFYFAVPFPNAIVVNFLPGLSPLPCVSLSLLVWLLIGNLQIPAAVAQIVLSSMRLRNLLHDPPLDYYPPQEKSGPNMVAATAAFYVLALCQGSLYVMASFLALLSVFPRRWLMRRSRLGGKLGAKAIDLYYERAYTTRMEMGIFGAGAAGNTMTFADFAIESLGSSSSSHDQKVAGLCVLHNMLQERRDDYGTQRLVLRVTSSSITVSTIVGMLAWTDVEVKGEHSYLIIRLLAATVTAELAGNLRISGIPGMLKLVSSLLKLAENTNHVVVVPNQREGTGHLAVANGGRWHSSVIYRFWQWMKQEYWSVPEEPTLLTYQDSSLPVLGMQILEKLGCDVDNCIEIFKDNTANLISNTVQIIGNATSDNQQDDALVCSSLEFLRRLATTGQKIGAALRHELWNHNFLLTSLARVLEDDHGSPQIWEPAMDIIAKLAMEKEAGLQIGKIQVITARLLQAFFGQHGPTNKYYDQSLRKVSGEALANLALWGTANCSAILEEPDYQVIIELTNMLSDDDYRYVGASLLLSLCEHCSVNLMRSHLHTSQHLSSALTTVMEHIMAAEDKQLECLINLASEIGDVSREAFVRELESQTNNGAELVHKLLCTVNSKKIPNPEYPRMRRVIVKILISIMESCRCTVEKLVEEGMMERIMESLTKIERAPSKVEEYSVFYGNIGVVPEDGEPMPTLVARAKALLVRRTTQTTPGALSGDHL